MAKSLKELLESPDPLTDDVLGHVIGFHEETTLVDFKLTFHPNEERAWLELTKDVLAFANTLGGYLAFGVRDGRYEIEGLDEAVIKILLDPNQVMQKVNRFVEPQITSLRSRVVDKDGKSCALVLIPASLGQTHLISKDGAFKFPSGEEKILLRQGTTYVRRSAGNHLVDARDLDAIISRRIDYFKSSLLDKIARVVDSPVDSKVLVVSEIPTDEPHSKFVISNASDALPVKGMSFTVSPGTTEEEISAWIALTARDPGALPPTATTWNWYRERKTLKLTEQQRIHAAVCCLLNNAPVFFWLQACNASEIKPALTRALSGSLSIGIHADVLDVAAFLGKRFHGSLVNKVSESTKARLGPSASFPTNGPRSRLRADTVVPKKTRSRTPAQIREELEHELDAIAASVKDLGLQEPALAQRWRAQQLDCYLYAQDDQYVRNAKTAEA